MAPQILDQSEGDKVCGPDQSDQPNVDKRIVGLVKTISSQNVSAEVKFEVMQSSCCNMPQN